MAPILQLLVTRSYHSHSSGGGSGGGIGGGVIAAIIVLMIVVFIWVYVSEYNEAKCAHAQTGRPISKGTCFKKAFLIAITLGVVSLLCTECCGLDSSSNGAEAGAGNVGGGPQMDQMGGGFVQQPQPTYQPQMNWTPVSDAAADGIQG